MTVGVSEERDKECLLFYQELTTTSAATANTTGDAYANNDDEPERLRVVKTSSKPMLLELKQFEALTSGTSTGSARVTSAHYVRVSSL